MTGYQYTEKENPLMSMSIDDLSYVLKLRKKIGDLESALQDVDDRWTYESGTHSSEVMRPSRPWPPGAIRLNLPISKYHRTGVEIWVSPDTQKKLIRAEMHEIKIEMLRRLGPNDQVEQVDVVE